MWGILHNIIIMPPLFSPYICILFSVLVAMLYILLCLHLFPHASFYLCLRPFPHVYTSYLCHCPHANLLCLRNCLRVYDRLRHCFHAHFLCLRHGLSAYILIVCPCFHAYLLCLSIASLATYDSSIFVPMTTCYTSVLITTASILQLFHSSATIK